MKANECNRCLLNEKIPGVKIKEDGICTVCSNYDNKYHDWDKNKKSRLVELEKTLEDAKRKRRVYDVLIPLSGGKDSVYVLYLCRKEYGLKCLAVTFDNGFLSDHARENIRKACNILRVDHIYYSISKPFLLRLYRYFFRKTGFFCPVCMAGIRTARTRMQISFNVPLAITGISLRTEEHVSKEYFLSNDASFLENVLKDNPLRDDAAALLNPVGLFHYPRSICLPDYADWDCDVIYDTITKELGWESNKSHEEHSDCILSSVVEYIRYRKFPDLIPELLRYSKLVTCGQMTRNEAKMIIEEIKNAYKKPKTLEWFYNEFEIDEREMDNILSDPMRHFGYLAPRSKILRRLHSLRSKAIKIV